MKKLFLNRKQHFSDFSDEKLADLFRKNQDYKIFEILFDRYIHLVFGVALKYLGDEEAARDAAMQVMQKLTVEIPRHEVKSFRNWIHTITKNHCLMQIRKAKINLVSLEDMHEKNKGTVMDFADEWHPINGDRSEAKITKLLGALTKIKTEQAECIKLFYLEKKSYQEVEQITGYSAKQVKSFIQNGKRKLKLILTEDEDFTE